MPCLFESLVSKVHKSLDSSSFDPVFAQNYMGRLHKELGVIVFDIVCGYDVDLPENLNECFHRFTQVHLSSIQEHPSLVYSYAETLHRFTEISLWYSQTGQLPLVETTRRLDTIAKQLLEFKHPPFFDLDDCLRIVSDKVIHYHAQSLLQLGRALQPQDNGINIAGEFVRLFSPLLPPMRKLELNKVTDSVLGARAGWVDTWVIDTMQMMWHVRPIRDLTEFNACIVPYIEKHPGKEDPYLLALCIVLMDRIFDMSTLKSVKSTALLMMLDLLKIMNLKNTVRRSTAETASEMVEYTYQCSATRELVRTFAASVIAIPGFEVVIREQLTGLAREESAHNKTQVQAFIQQNKIKDFLLARDASYVTLLDPYTKVFIETSDVVLRDHTDSVTVEQRLQCLSAEYKKIESKRQELLRIAICELRKGLEYLDRLESTAPVLSAMQTSLTTLFASINNASKANGNSSTDDNLSVSKNSY